MNLNKIPLLNSQSMDQELYSKNLEHNENLRLFLNTNKEKVNKKNRLLKLQEERSVAAEKILQDKVISMSIRPAVKGDEGQSFAEKRILPFFSVPVILKKISDKKKYKNLNLLNPQKKLIYKIIRLNKRLEKLVKSINKYNLNLNSFKGSKLDFILFLRNNLYFNLKIRFSNIFYKIDLIKATYNIINDNNSKNNNKNSNISNKLSPLEMLDKLIASSDKASNNKKSTNKINKIATISSNIKTKNKGMSVSTSKSLTQASDSSLGNNNTQTFLDNIVTILNNYSKTQTQKNNTLISNSLSRKYKSGLGTKDISHLFISNMIVSRINQNSSNAPEVLEVSSFNKESEIKYLLFKLNNLIKKIEYIINIININETFLKKIEKINSGRAITINSINNEIHDNEFSQQNTQQLSYRKEKELLSLVPNKKIDLYNQISN